MSVAPGLYAGTVRHRRFAPRPHAFEYSLFMALLDVDRVPEAMAVSRWTSYNCWNWAAFHDRDHVGDVPRTLRERMQASAAAAGEALPDGPIYLLTHLRYLGYVFNPISIYYCHASDGTLARVLADVSNTYGGRRSYWLRPPEGTANDRRFRAVTSKQMYVSPFMPFDVDYEFVLTAPAESLVAHIDVSRQSEAPGRRRSLFDATLTLRRRPWSAREVRRALTRFPWMTAKVIATVYFEALRLRLKNLPVMPFPVENNTKNEEKNATAA